MINIDEDNISTGIASGENRGRFDKGTDQVSRGSSDVSRTSYGVAAKIQWSLHEQEDSNLSE